MNTLISILLSALIFTQSAKDDKKAERTKMLDKLFVLLEENIADPAWLENESFYAFKELVYSDSVLSLSDKEFISTFNNATVDLPFSHFRLHQESEPSKSKSKKRNAPISWEEIDDKTAYLEINTFMISGGTVAETLQQIGTNKYENLILDLRNNGGGILEGPVALGRYLTQMPIDAGYHLTRKWFENHDSLPASKDVQEMTFLQDFTLTGIKKLFAEEEAFRMVVPAHDNPIYQGNVYILTSKKTASACEPLLDLFKKHNLATLVGETSAGKMLNGSNFIVNENCTVFLPTADYYTVDGTKIDKVGVSPHIEVEVTNAKAHVLQLIKEAQ